MAIPWNMVISGGNRTPRKKMAAPVIRPMRRPMTISLRRMRHISSYQPQPVLTEAVKALASYQDKAKVETFLLEALKHAYNDYLIKDFINAYSLLKEGKLPDQSDNALAAAAVKLLSGNGDAICHLRACPGKLGEAATAQAGSPQPALVASISPKAGDLTVRTWG